MFFTVHYGGNAAFCYLVAYEHENFKSKNVWHYITIFLDLARSDTYYSVVEYLWIRPFWSIKTVEEDCRFLRKSNRSFLKSLFQKRFQVHKNKNRKWDYMSLTSDNFEIFPFSTVYACLLFTRYKNL